MLFEIENLTDQAREDLKKAGIFEGILGELWFQGFRREIAEQLIVLTGDDLQCCFR